VTEDSRFDAEALREAQRHCAALVREHARDLWLASLYANPAARDGLIALAAFTREIALARFRARDPNLVALRLLWWRDVVRGERKGEAAGSPVALALHAAIDAFALPVELLEAMLDGRLEELTPSNPFDLAAFESFAAMSEGARLRLAARIAARGHDLDAEGAHGPAGRVLALTGMVRELPMRAPALVPADVAARHGASMDDFAARRATPGVIAALSELRALARETLGEAERRLEGSPPAILPAFMPLATARLELDRLDRNSNRPFDPAAEISPLRRQWAIWRWARRF
jgi:phytoene synthase